MFVAACLFVRIQNRHRIDPFALNMIRYDVVTVVFHDVEAHDASHSQIETKLFRHINDFILIFVSIHVVEDHVPVWALHVAGFAELVSHLVLSAASTPCFK